MTRTRVLGVISDAQLVDVEPEVVRHPDRDRHWRRPDEPGQRFVDRVARVGHEDLVARIDQRQDRVQHHALAADRDEHPVRLDREALAGRRVGGDRLAQGGDARERRVVGRTRVERGLGRSPDVGRGIEVRLADLEVDDRAAFGLERARPGRDLERALGADRAHPGGDAHGVTSDQGSIWRSTKRTLAGRSASRRMYHGYQ